LHAEAVRQAFEKRHRRVEVIVCEQSAQLSSARGFAALRKAGDHPVEVSGGLEIGFGDKRRQSAQIVGERRPVDGVPVRGTLRLERRSGRLHTGLARHRLHPCGEQTNHLMQRLLERSERLVERRARWRAQRGLIIASGSHTSALLMGLTASHFSSRGSMVGLEFWFRFRRPVHADETVHVEWLVAKVTPNARLKGDIVDLRGRIRREDGQTAVGAKGRVLVTDQL
jgi:hypothetical protein